MDKKVINLTSHPINILDEQNNVINTFPAGNTVLRLPVVEKTTGAIGKIPIKEKKYIMGMMPERKKDTFYIVSLPIAQLARRKDFLVPNDIVRDDSGSIIGCRSFSIIK